MKKTHFVKRFFVLMLVILTLICYLPVTALAEGTDVPTAEDLEGTTPEDPKKTTDLYNVEDDVSLIPSMMLMEALAATSVTTAAELNAVFQNGGEAVLDSNITLSAPLVVASGKTVILDLNGKTIDRGLAGGTALSNGNVITVEGTLTLNDSQGSGKITGGKKGGYTGGGGVYVDGGAFTMNGGTISGNSSKQGGGVYVDEGSFTMNTGTISGNTAAGTEVGTGHGGGVAVLYGGSFIMKAGEISSNAAEGYSTMAGHGGGVYINMSGSCIIEGGTISQNEAEQGGGVYLDGSAYLTGPVSSFTMSAGEISDNITDPLASSGYGGGLYVASGNLTLSGGRISGNEAAQGGGVFMLGGTCTMADCEIVENITFETLLCHGGGVYLAGGDFTMNSGKINRNKAVNGGGLYRFGGTFNMNGGQINDNGTYVLTGQMCDGGGVYLSSSGTFNMEGGEIHGNSTSAWNMYNHGGGVAVYGGTFRVSGNVSITGNSRSGVPNNVYLKAETNIIEVTDALTAADGTIGISTGNAPEGTTSLVVAQRGGIYVISSSDLGKFVSDIGGELKLQDNKIALSKPSTSYLIYLSYDSNGGSGTHGSSPILKGTDMPLTVASGDGFSRTNCSFAGWNTQPDGSGAWYQADQILILTDNTTLYAQWKIDRTVLAVAAPQGGGAPSNSVTCSPLGITTAIAWKQGGDSVTGSFDFNTEYTASITLNAGSGCTFAEAPEARMNGQTAAIESRSSTVLVVSYTFAKTGPRSIPAASMSPTVTDIANSGGTRSLTLNVTGIAEGYNPVTWTMSETDSSNILTLPSTTGGTLSNGALNLGAIIVAPNSAGHPLKSASVIITFDGNEDGEYAGVPASITVTFRLAAGNAPDVTLDYINERITGVSEGMEYLVDESDGNPDNWTDATPVTGTEIPLGGIIPNAGSKYIHIRLMGISGGVPNNTRIPARPDLHDSYSWIEDGNILNDEEMATVPPDCMYRVDGDDEGENEDRLNTGSYLDIYYLDSGDRLTIWQPATASSFKSGVITVTAPDRLANTTVAIDFAQKKLSTGIPMQYRMRDSDAWTECTANMDAADFGWDGTEAVSVQFRYPSTETNYASKEQILTIPAYPAPPTISYTKTATTVTVTAETGVRYRIDGGEWKTGGEDGKVIFTGLAPNHSYTMEAQKTETHSAFQSEVASMSLLTNSLEEGTGSVSMASWTYGGTAAEPVPVSATNGTGSVTYTYAGTKADGTPYSSSTKPSAAGSYTVTATFAATSEYKPVTSEPASFTIIKKKIDAQWTNLHFVYDGTEKQATLTLPGLEPGDSSAVSVSITDGQRISAGFQRVTASLNGSGALNYTLTNPDGILMIQRAPVTFTVGDNSIPYDGAPKTASVTATANGSAFAGFTITYKQGGTLVLAPAAVGSYDIYASFLNANYRHVEGADGAERKIGVLTIFDLVPASYKTSFAPGGGSGTMGDLAEAVAGTVRILPDCAFAATAGYVFDSWILDGKRYAAGAAFVQPARNVSLTAQWVQVHSVGGVVTRNGSPVEGAVVTLIHGPHRIGETITDALGRYQFDNVQPGIYNLTGVKDGVTITIMKEVKTADVMGADIALPLGKTNSVVEVLAGTPAIVVGNLEKIFDKQDGMVYTGADQAAVDSGGTVEIRIVAKVVAEDPGNSDQNMIEGHAPSSNLGLYLEMSLNKSVASGGSPVETPLTASNTLLEIVVPLPAELQGKDNYIVYRCHEGEVQTLTTTPNSNGEYIAVNDGKTAITIHAKLFSTYSIGYLEQEVPAPGNSGHSSHSLKAAPVKPAGLPYYLDGNGNKIFLGFSFDSSGEMKYIAPNGETVLFEENVKNFTDIANHWAKSSIDFITQREVFQGTDKSTFSPNTGMTRGMFAAVIGRLYERSYGLHPGSETTAFSDVAADAYYAAYVNWAAKNEIMKGSGGGKFAPDRPITRGEMASILYRFARFLNLSGIDMEGTQLHYTDAEEINSWAIDGAKYCQETDLIAGRSNGKFASKETATRAEVATILQRFINTVVK